MNLEPASLDRPVRGAGCEERGDSHDLLRDKTRLRIHLRHQRR